MKALKICIIIAWLIALAVFAYSWISEPTKTNEAGDEMIWIGHKTVELESLELESRPNEGTNQTVTSVFTFDTVNTLDAWTNLFQLRVQGVPIVTVKPNGDVIYDTNNVSEATRIFWQEMTYQARKVTERIGK